MIKVEEVVNTIVTDLHISYEEPDISMKKMQQIAGSVMTPRGWKQRQIRAEDLVAVLFIEDSDMRESWLNCGALIYDQRMPSR